MKTQKLYDSDAYLKSFTATVISVTEKDGNFYTELDKTAFFPESGGQTGDNGNIGNAAVINTVIEGDTIYHICDKPLEKGKEYAAAIDFAARFDKMQNHSGEHIISGIVHALFGYENIGFHLSDNTVTLDFDGALSAADIAKIELMANAAVQQNVKITAYYPKPEELKSITYRSKLELTENVRLVVIENYDICACCAPHVATAGEIGIIKITAHEKHKNGVRLTIKCGMRAVKDYAERFNSVSRISALLCAKPEEISDAVKALKSTLAEKEFELLKLRRESIKATVQSLAPQKNICIFAEDIDTDTMRYAANLLKEKAENCGVFVKSGDRCNYVCCSKNDITDFCKALNSALGGSGGGRNGMCQGSVTATKDEIEKFFNRDIDNM